MRIQTLGLRRFLLIFFTCATILLNAQEDFSNRVQNPKIYDLAVDDSIKTILIDAITGKSYRFFLTSTQSYAEGIVKIGVDGEDGDMIRVPQYKTGLINEENKKFHLGHNYEPLLIYNDVLVCYKRDFFNGKTVLKSYSIEHDQMADSLVFNYPYMNLSVIDDSAIAIDEGTEIKSNIIILDYKLEHLLTYSPFKDRQGFSIFSFKKHKNQLHLDVLSSDLRVKSAIINLTEKSVQDIEYKLSDSTNQNGSFSKIYSSKTGVLLYQLTNDQQMVLTKFDFTGKAQWHKEVILPFDYLNLDLALNFENDKLALLTYVDKQYNIEIINSESGQSYRSINSSQFFLSHRQESTPDPSIVFPYGEFKWLDDNYLIFLLCGYESDTKQGSNMIVVYNSKTESFTRVQHSRDLFQLPIKASKLNDTLVFFTKNKTVKYE